MATRISRLMTVAIFAFALLLLPSRAQDTPTASDATGATGADVPTGPSDDSISFQTFYDSLGSMGTWIQTKDYGYVWQPQESDPGWAPYTLGHWAYTDDGWAWLSDEPFGWATYHYGRWVNLDGTGWVWVPGYTWAPAWVSWRYGEGYAGWAPLPPDSMAGVDYSTTGSTTDSTTDTTDDDGGFHVGADSDYYYGIGAGYYIFIPINFLCFHDYRGHYCNRGDNYWIINHTQNVTNLNVTRHGTFANGESQHDGRFHHVTIGGPPLEDINAASQTPMQKLRLTRTNQPGAAGMTQNSVVLYAPRVAAGTTTAPSRLGTPLDRVKINRGTDINHPLMVNSLVVPQAATPDQVQQAQSARTQVPQNAKVMTDASSVTPVLPGPVSSLRPIGAAPRNFSNSSSAANGFHSQGQVFAPQTSTYPTRDDGSILSRDHAPPQLYSSGTHVQQQTTTGGTQFNPYAPRQTAPAATSSGGSGQRAPVASNSSGRSSEQSTSQQSSGSSVYAPGSYPSSSYSGGSSPSPAPAPSSSPSAPMPVRAR